MIGDKNVKTDVAAKEKDKAKGKTKGFEPTAKQKEALSKKASKIHTLSATCFESVLTIGCLIHEAREMLCKKTGGKGYWGKWIQEDLGFTVRTGQYYRDTYRYFSPESAEKLGSFEMDYLVDLTYGVLAKFLRLKRKFEEKGYDGPVKEIKYDGQIMLTYQDPQTEEEVTEDLLELKRSEKVKWLLNPEKQQKVKPDTSKMTLEDAEGMDLRKLNDTASLKWMVRKLRKELETYKLKDASTPAPAKKRGRKPGKKKNAAAKTPEAA